MREFNIFGPVDPEYHYHVDRVTVKAALRQRIDQGRYLTLNAARQTGKTTLFREVIAELMTGGDYFGILLDFELLADFDKTDFYEQLGRLLNRWRTRFRPSAPEVGAMRHQGDFDHWLRMTVRTLAKRGVLIIDEFDAVGTELIKPILSQFRGMYLERGQPEDDGLHSVILVGVRHLPDLLAGTQSPFNIADQFTVPYFSPDEIAGLLKQHTIETGQVFDIPVIEGITRETEGQPFLVNRLGQLLTQEIVPDHSQAVTLTALNYALAKLVNENNTHFASIRSKAALYRSEVIDALFSAARYYDFQDEMTQDLLMYGIFRVVNDDQGVAYARLANPIYRKMLVKAFAPSHALIRQATNGTFQNRFLVNSHLNVDALLDAFKAFMEEHGVRLLKSETTSRPLEISGQYLLLSYLTAALRSIGGYVTIEALSSAGEMDILAFYREQRFIVETKIWYGQARYEEGRQQLAAYLQAGGLTKGYMVVFDEQLTKNPLLTKAGAIFEVTEAEKTLRVYLVGVAV